MVDTDQTLAQAEALLNDDEGNDEGEYVEEESLHREDLEDSNNMQDIIHFICQLRQFHCQNTPCYPEYYL